MAYDIADLFAQRERDRYAMHSHHLNEQLVRVLKAIGYDVGFRRGKGQYLYDREGTRYLDLLSGYGVFAIGRNHPALREALKSVLDSELPNLVQMDVSTLAGILAERLLEQVPYLDKAFFANSGSEAVEAAIKFARAATGRPGIIYCEHAFHGLSYGALSLNGDDIFRNGFEPLLPGCVRIPFNDLVALDKALHSCTIAAFIVEPIQGKGVNIPADDYLESAVDLCHQHGTLFVADEVQTGMDVPAGFLRSNTGMSNRIWFSLPKRCPADTYRWGPFLRERISSTKSSIAWTAQWRTDQPSETMTSRWRPESRHLM